MRTVCTLLLAYFVSISSIAAAEHWNQFRGPEGDGKASAVNLPTEFSNTKNIRWRTPIHDQGWSSPVVWEKQIWLTTARRDGSRLYAVCVDLESGRIIHDIQVFEIETPQLEWAEQNSHASPTPIVQQGRVYVHFGTYGTACLDTKTGKKLWERRDLNCDHRVRPASSPIIDGDSLFLTFDGVDVQFVASLDKNTGETLWRQDRAFKMTLAETLKGTGADPKEVAKQKPNDNRKSYATPTIIEHQGRRQLISPAAEATYSYDPQTGDELWRVRHAGWGWNLACRPVYEEGLLYFSTGVAQRMLAVDPSGAGDITDTHVAWTTRRSAPELPSPILVADLMFMIDDDGIASCLEAKTGEEVWRKRIGGNHWASPLYAAGRIYFFNKSGEVTVIAADREFQVLAENRLGAGFIASPAVVGDAILLRSRVNLYCVAEGHTTEAPVVSEEEILDKARPMSKKKSAGKTGPKDTHLAKLGVELKEAVRVGTMTQEDAMAAYQKAVAKRNQGNTEEP